MGVGGFFGVSQNVMQGSVHERKKQASTKAEERELEMENLKPDKLSPYAGEKPGTSDVKKRAVKIVFKSAEDFEKFKRYFYVSEYVEPSVTNIDLLVALLDELDSGRIQYDKRSRRIIYHTD